jgi:uncharacterized protein
MSRFLRRHHVLALSTVSGQGPWTAHCFYAWLPDHAALVFTTGPETRHGRDMVENPMVSAGIALETKVIGKIRGIQLSGRAVPVDGLTGTADAASCRTAYLLRFPFAVAAKLDLWMLTVDYIKMTDNRLGFGKKLEWRRP